MNYADSTRTRQTRDPRDSREDRGDRDSNKRFTAPYPDRSSASRSPRNGEQRSDYGNRTRSATSGVASGGYRGRDEGADGGSRYTGSRPPRSSEQSGGGYRGRNTEQSGGGYRGRDEGAGRGSRYVGSRPPRNTEQSGGGYRGRNEGADRGSRSAESRPPRDSGYSRDSRPPYGDRPSRGATTGDSRGSRSTGGSYQQRSGSSDRGSRSSDQRREGWSPRTNGFERSDARYGEQQRRPERDLRDQQRPGVGPRANEPEPPEIDPKQVPRNVAAELKSLPKDLAAIVAAHLVAAGELIEIAPELAYAHAEAAKRRAARLPIAREALAETAYAAGHFDVALTEFRALRRMTGSPDYIAVLADCERALGRPDAALRLVREGEGSVKDPSLLIELRIVQAGARADAGQKAEALRLLAGEIESPRGVVPPTAQARLRFAYAALLLEQGDIEAARNWFTAAARIDPEATDAQERLDELNGFVLITDFPEDEEEEELEATSDDGEAESQPEPDESQEDLHEIVPEEEHSSEAQIEIDEAGSQRDRLTPEDVEGDSAS